MTIADRTVGVDVNVTFSDVEFRKCVTITNGRWCHQVNAIVTETGRDGAAHGPSDSNRTLSVANVLLARCCRHRH